MTYVKVMTNNFRKVHYVENGQHFIRFSSGKAEFVVSVLEFEKEEDLLNSIVSHSAALKQKNLPYLASSMRFENKFYFFVATEFVKPLDPENKKEIFRLKRIMDRLAMWFKHTILMQQEPAE